MAKELLIYRDVSEYSAIDFINGMNYIDSSEELVVRVNTNGGSPEYGWGMVAKFREFEGKKTVKVDGKAYSTGFNFLLYAENVEALDVSQFLVHRAAYPKWFEGSEYFTEALKENLKSINKDLELALRNKIDVAAFEEMKGVSIKDIFSMEDRKDVFLTAKEAKKIGLISKIIKITPAKKADIKANLVSIAAKYGGNFELEVENKSTEPKSGEETNNKSKKINMNIEELQAKHPELFAQIVGMGVAKENERINAWLVFNDADKEVVKAGIESGKDINMVQVSELAVKRASLVSLANIENENNENVNTDASNAGVFELTELEKITAKVNAELGINQDKK